MTVNKVFVSIPTELFAYCLQLSYFSNASICPSSRPLLSMYMFKVLLVIIASIFFLSISDGVATMLKILCAFSQFS